MSKKISKKILSLIIFFLVILVLFLGIYKILSHGIGIERIAVGKINLSKLYLKLDNKLILQIQELDLRKILKTSNHKPVDVDRISEYIRYFTWGIAYFETLSIQKIVLDEKNIANVFYDGKHYKIRFPKIEASFGITEDPGRLKLDIQTLRLSEIQSQIEGRIVYLPIKNELAFDLRASYIPTKDKVILQGYTNLKRLHMEIKTNKIRNLDFTTPFVKNFDNPSLKEWLYEKVFFDEAKIEKITFNTQLTQRGFLAGIKKSLKGKITIKTAEVSLFNSLDSIKATEVQAIIDKQNITLNLKNPTYGAMDLEGSSIDFVNLLTTPKIIFNIKSKQFSYDTSLLNLLENYHLSIPVESVDSKLDADLKLTIQFLQDHEHLISLGGSLETRDAQVKMFDIPFFSSQVNVGFDITPQYQYVYIRANDAYYYNMLSADIDGVLDLKEQNYKAKLKVHSARINTNQEINYQKPYQSQEVLKESEEEEIKIPRSFDPKSLSPLQLKKYILASIKEDEKPYTQDILNITSQEDFIADVIVDFSKHDDIRVILPEFETNLTIQDQLFIINFDNLALFNIYSPLLTYLDIKSGNVRIETKDFKSFDLLFSIDNLWLPLYEHGSNKNITSLEFSGNINEDGVQIKSLDKKITFQRKYAQNTISVKGYDFNVNEFLESKIPAIKQALHGDDEIQGNSPTKEEIDYKLDFLRQKHQYQRQHRIKAQMTNIEITDMVLFYKEYKIPTDEIDIRFRDQRILADLTYKNGIANVDFIDGDIYIKASNFSADFVNLVAQKEVINGGLFTLIGAYKNQSFSGELKIQNTLFKNFVVLQNIINLIDTVPSLIVFKNPNLGAKGYQVSRGNIVFGINKDYIGLENIHLIGDSMDIDGNGIIQLANKEMNINLEISTIKNFSNILSKIPIIGYLALGSDGKISTNVSLNGTLDNPKTSISLAEDVVTAPFRILRRVFQPLNLIVDEIKNEIKNDAYRQEK